MVKPKILVHTDIGSDIDDALALLVMLNHPEIELAGIYTVNGDVDSRCYIAQHVVNLAGKKIPVARGAAEPVGAEVPPYGAGVDYLVDNSFIDDRRMEEEHPAELLFQPFKRVGIISNGLEYFAQQLHQERCVVFSIAPLTNLALLLQQHPEAARNIERLYIMGCRFPPGQHLEHNLRYDSAAAKQVLGSGIPTTIVPADVCEKYRMPARYSKQLHTPPGQYVRRMLDSFLGGKVATEFHQKIISGENLSKILQKIVTIDPEKAKQLPPEEQFHIQGKKGLLIENLDLPAAYCEPEEFWENYRTLIELIRNPRYGFKLGSMMAEELDKLIPTSVAVHDVYVPYSYLHPERLVVEQMTLTCDKQGHTYIIPGSDHEVVRDLDWEHFRWFVQEYIK